MQKVVIVENVRSVLNVGSLFRTANALGVHEIILVGITPTPLDTYGIPRKDFAKVALGSEKGLPWRYEKTIVPTILEYKKQGFSIVSLEQNDNSIDYKEEFTSDKIVLVVGSEVEGVSKEVLFLSDRIIEIPMLGLKESLNVTIAFGVLGYKLFDR